jgi:hypothetical protein
MAARLATAADLPPEFASVDAGVSAFWLGVAAEQVSIAVNGELTSMRHAMLTAHYLALAGHGGGGPAPIRSKQVGDVKVDYAVSEVRASSLSSTKYGQIYQSLAPFRGPIVA